MSTDPKWPFAFKHLADLPDGSLSQAEVEHLLTHMQIRDERIEELEAENERLREALRVYADPVAWEVIDWDQSRRIDESEWRAASAALTVEGDET